MTHNLTADLFARAIIAAGVSTGELVGLRPNADAITILSVFPAAAALAAETDYSLARVCGVLHCTPEDVTREGLNGKGRNAAFRKARDAAREAIRHNLAIRPLRVIEVPEEPEARPDLTRAPVRFHRAPLPPASTARERIVEALGVGAMSMTGLATFLDVKELVVGQVMRNLEVEGRVISAPMPDGGRRYQHWQLVEVPEAEAAA